MSDIDTPADPKSTFSYRAAKFAVIVLSALIILALIGLVVGGIMKFTSRAKPVFAGSGGTAFVLPPGAKIVSSENQPGRLSLHLRNNGADEIDIVSTEDGHLIARIAPPH